MSTTTAEAPITSGSTNKVNLDPAKQNLPRIDVPKPLIGAHLPYWDGSVKAMQSMFFTKPPGYPGQAWHQDEIYIPTRDRTLCGAWVALDDATIENGCLYVIPKSHRSGYLYPQHPHTRD